MYGSKTNVPRPNIPAPGKQCYLQFSSFKFCLLFSFFIFVVIEKKLRKIVHQIERLHIWRRLVQMLEIY